MFYHVNKLIYFDTLRVAKRIIYIVKITNNVRIWVNIKIIQKAINTNYKL